MLLSYKFSNLCGSIYKKGNIVFSETKNILFSPVGNKLTVIDLENNLTSTLPVETRSDISKIAISPDSGKIVLVDEEGYAIIVNLITNQIISHFNFKAKLSDLKFSPDGKFLAASTDVDLKVFEAPGFMKSIEPLVLYKKLKAIHTQPISALNWSPDSRFIVTMSKDLTVKVWALHQIPDYQPFSFTGHKRVCVHAFFSPDMKFLSTIGKDGIVLVWKFVDDYITENYQKLKAFQQFKPSKKIKITETKGKIVKSKANENEENKGEEDAKDNEEDAFLSDFERKCTQGRFILDKRQEITSKNTAIKIASYHSPSKLLTIGFKNGTFGLYQVEENQFSDLQTFAITDNKFTTIAVNPSGSWLAFGVAKNNQLMVWEWRSQTYIFNQQGFSFDIECLDYSYNGKIIASGTSEGKVKLWDSKSYFCFATFTEHVSKVSAIKFTPKSNNTLITASYDGTVRAFDTSKYRNFRVMKADMPTQFCCLAIDPSGEVVCAGSVDPYSVYCWSLQTGNLLEVLSGHEGPISCLAFSPIDGVLVSGSWDKSLRVHDLYAKNRDIEILEHNSEITDVCFRPDGLEICCTTLKGEIYLWNIKDRQIRGTLDCRRDLDGGRIEQGKLIAKKDTSNKHFKSLCYSADGDYVLAAGRSKYICLYEIRHRLLVRRFKVSKNRAFDGMLSKLNSKNIKDNININEIDNFSDSDFEERKDNVLPGSKHPNFMKRNTKLIIEIKGLKFSPNGQSWAAATTEGISIFSGNQNQYFNPYELSEGVSKEAVLSNFKKGDYFNALIMSLQINEDKLLEAVFLNVNHNFCSSILTFNKIPKKCISSICPNIPVVYLERFLSLLSEKMEKTEKFELMVDWLASLMFNFNEIFSQNDMKFNKLFKNISKIFQNRFLNIANIANENIYFMEFVLSNLKLQETPETRVMDLSDG